MAKRHREDGDERPEESNVDLERETPCMSSQETLTNPSANSYLKKSRRHEQRGVYAVKHTSSPGDKAECFL